MLLHKGDKCGCGCGKQLKHMDRVVEVTEGVVDLNPNEEVVLPGGKEVLYLKECWDKLPKEQECGASGRFCGKQGCGIWDAAEERCSLLSIAINTKRIGKEKL